MSRLSGSLLSLLLRICIGVKFGFLKFGFLKFCRVGRARGENSIVLSEARGVVGCAAGVRATIVAKSSDPR